VTPGGGLADLIDRGDLDELVRTADRLTDAADWDGLVELRDRSRAALERGRQLWPVASLAEYRLALCAPGPWAGAVIREGAGRFALGPLPEVAASTHAWEELAAHVPDGPLRAVTAHERVVRGEDLRDAGRVPEGIIDLPLAPQPWEPTYPLASYEPEKADFPIEPVTLPRSEALPAPGSPIADLRAATSLRDLVTPWTSESNGRCEVTAVRGDGPAAVAALGPRRARIAPVDAADALARMAWAGASGGAHGRRRGMAAGRFAAWWALAALADLGDDWPVTPDELGAAAAELRWWLWDAGEPELGWALRVAVDDPAHGLAWAVAATDDS